MDAARGPDGEAQDQSASPNAFVDGVDHAARDRSLAAAAVDPRALGKRHYLARASRAASSRGREGGSRRHAASVPRDFWLDSGG